MLRHRGSLNVVMIKVLVMTSRAKALRSRRLFHRSAVRCPRDLRAP